ncbi:MAG TPA: glycosyltransferase [Caulobacteraceae bacterium]|nr:glycosyltransferase [Caulobacteraceae bacterium]
MPLVEHLSPGLTLAGVVELATSEELAGWAWDPANPSSPVIVEGIDGTETIFSVLADEPREDLLAAGLGNGRHGFRVKPASWLFERSRNDVVIRRAHDRQALFGSPARVEVPEKGLDESATAFLYQSVGATCALAQSASDLNKPVSILLQLLGALLAAQDRLAVDVPGERQDFLQRAELGNAITPLLSKLLNQYDQLHLEESPEVDVSVVIPAFNHFRYTYNCISSLITNHPDDTSFEIILIDDCSKDETILSSMLFSGDIRVIRNERNAGFVSSCNSGAAVARGEYLFFLNNDTVVKPGWLDTLVTTFKRMPVTGIAGSKLLFEDGRLQEAGGIVWRMGDGWNWGRGLDPNDPKFCYLRDADWVSGAALMIPKKLFDELGGFDVTFAPGYYEDTDLAFRVRAAGRRVVVQPGSEVVHFEGVSSGTDESGSGMKRFQPINRRKFYARWRDTLGAHAFNGDNPEAECERGVRKKAVFIDDTVPTPDRDAGSNAALEHMMALIGLGYKVTFIPADNMAQIEPYTKALQFVGVECLYAPYFWSVEEVFRKKRVDPGLVYLHRFSNARKYALMVKSYFPEARVIYNVADLHFLRMEREDQLKGAVRPETISQRSAELGVMRDVDCVVVHSPAEAELVGRMVPGVRVEVVPWTVRLNPVSLPFGKRQGIGFLGSFGHPPNLDAVRHLKQGIAPGVMAALPNVKFYIAGSGVTDEVRALQSERFEILGHVSDLNNLFGRVRATVVPLRFGAGIKGKVLESLARGIPCIMSEVAAEGLSLAGELGWLVARSPEEMVQKLVSVHEDRELNSAMARAGLEFIKRGFGTPEVLESLARAIGPAAQPVC